MGLQNITAGNKVAKAVGIRMIQADSAKKTVGVEVAFGFKEGQAEERLSWIGWLSELAIDRTMKTLVDVLNYDGDDEFKDGCITKDDVEIVVEMEPAVDKDGNAKCDKDGKQYVNPRIKWVNKLGGSAFKAVAPESVKADLAKINFKGAFAMAKASSGRGNTAPAAAQAPTLSDEEIPF